ncbi:MAG: polyprenyl diphosphate synthase [Thermodesulfobacteriota bacterium]
MGEKTDLPPLTHLAIIMDGNGRWAKQRGLSRGEGHKAGTETAREIVKECRRQGISYLTLYAFSRENWSRPKNEVNFLFDLLIKFLKQEESSLIEQSIRLNILGDWQKLPFSVRQVVKYVCNKTAGGDQMTLNLALNYSGREEIVKACRDLISQGISPEEVDEDVFRRCLTTGDQPDPDLILRTSGEYRLSNYLIFQAAYSEFYFTSKYWPDFDSSDLHVALQDFANRQRRYGGTGE